MVNRRIDRVEIGVYPRLHLSLVDMGLEGYRRAGGLGFSVDCLLTQLVFIPSDTVSVSLLLQKGYSPDEVATLSGKIQALKEQYSLDAGLSLSSVSPFKRHVGLGSGTAITLATTEALFLINGRKIGDNELKRLSGRGGTSGVGLNTYFCGGFVCDLGHTPDSNEFLPSEWTTPSKLPLVLSACEMADWEVGLYIPNDIRPLNSQQEKEFFASTCPISMRDVHETAYHAFFGVLSSILESDRKMFHQAVNALQKCRWKASEIAIYGEVIVARMAEFRHLGCSAVGMSSLGPSLFFFADDM